MPARSTAVNALAAELGRRAWGIDLSRKYLEEFAVPRLERLSRFAGAETKAYRTLNAKLNAKLSGSKKLRM